MAESLESRIEADLADAMRSGDELRRRTLRLVRAELKNASIQARGPLSADDVIAVIQRQAQQRREAAAQFEQGGRQDLVQRELEELAVLELYLPKQLSDAEIEAIVQEQIAAVGATSPSEIGRVMVPLMGKLAGRADGARVSAAARRLLGG